VRTSTTETSHEAQELKPRRDPHQAGVSGGQGAVRPAGSRQAPTAASQLTMASDHPARCTAGSQESSHDTPSREGTIEGSFVCPHTNKTTLEFPNSQQGQASSSRHPKPSATPEAALPQAYSLQRVPGLQRDLCSTSRSERWEVLKHKHFNYFLFLKLYSKKKGKKRKKHPPLLEA